MSIRKSIQQFFTIKPLPSRSLLRLKTSLGTKTIYPYTLKQATPIGSIFLSKVEYSLFLKWIVPAFSDKLDKSLILGDRQNSSYFVRIYPIQSNSSLKFELEIKKRGAKKLGLLLLHSVFTEFESVVSRNYFNHLTKSLSLQTLFTHCLLDSLRFKLPKLKIHLVGSYLKKYFLT